MDRQSELKKAQEDYERTLLRLDESWSSRIVDFGKETERLQKEHQKETERVRLEFINRWKPDLLKAQLKIQEAKLTKFQDQLLETEIAVKTKRDTLTQIKKQIQSQPQYLVLSKAMTDEALWDKIESVQAELPEELNRLPTTQIEYEALVPKSDHLKSELERIRETIDELQSLITEKEIELFALLKDTELELKHLLVDRKTELAVLTKAHESEVTRLKREKDFQINESNREVAAARRAYEPVAEKYKSVELAKVQLEESDVKIRALAVAPGRPIGRRTSLNTPVALVVGFMLSVLLAFVLEYAQSISLTESPQAEIDISPSPTPGLELDSPSPRQANLAGH